MPVAAEEPRGAREQAAVAPPGEASTSTVASPDPAPAAETGREQGGQDDGSAGDTANSTAAPDTPAAALDGRTPGELPASDTASDTALSAAASDELADAAPPAATGAAEPQVHTLAAAGAATPLAAPPPAPVSAISEAGDVDAAAVGSEASRSEAVDVDGGEATPAKLGNEGSGMVPAVPEVMALEGQDTKGATGGHGEADARVRGGTGRELGGMAREEADASIAGGDAGGVLHVPGQAAPVTDAAASDGEQRNSVCARLRLCFVSPAFSLKCVRNMGAIWSTVEDPGESFECDAQKDTYATYIVATRCCSRKLRPTTDGTASGVSSPSPSGEEASATQAAASPAAAQAPDTPAQSQAERDASEASVVSPAIDSATGEAPAQAGDKDAAQTSDPDAVQAGDNDADLLAELDLDTGPPPPAKENTPPRVATPRDAAPAPPTPAQAAAAEAARNAGAQAADADKAKLPPLSRPQLKSAGKTQVQQLLDIARQSVASAQWDKARDSLAAASKLPRAPAKEIEELLAKVRAGAEQQRSEAAIRMALTRAQEALPADVGSAEAALAQAKQLVRESSGVGSALLEQLTKLEQECGGKRSAELVHKGDQHLAEIGEALGHASVGAAKDALMRASKAYTEAGVIDSRKGEVQEMAQKIEALERAEEKRLAEEKAAAEEAEQKRLAAEQESVQALAQARARAYAERLAFVESGETAVECAVDLLRRVEEGTDDAAAGEAREAIDAAVAALEAAAAPCTFPDVVPALSERIDIHVLQVPLNPKP